MTPKETDLTTNQSRMGRAAPASRKCFHSQIQIRRQNTAKNMVRNFTSRIPSRAACAALLLLTPPLRTASASLSLNGEGRPQSLTDVICPGRPRRECEVQLDVPRACSGASSDCPIVLYLHGAGGTIEEFPGTTGVHSAGYIGVYPQGEDGWNTNPKDINDCRWDDFGCTEDPDEGDFIASIISHLRSLGAGGNVYAVGFSNGSALAHRLAANAGPSLPIKGIVGMVANMLASPTRSGPGVLNYNQPGNSGNTLPVSVLSVMGTADTLIPYNGGSSEVFQVEGGDAFQFLPSLDAMQIWAQHNSCGGANSPETSEQQWSMDGRSGVATRFVYTNCPNGVLVEHYAVQGGGHGSGDAVIDGVSMTYDIAYNFIDRVEAGGVPPTPPPPTSSPPPGDGDDDDDDEESEDNNSMDNESEDFESEEFQSEDIQSEDFESEVFQSEDIQSEDFESEEFQSEDVESEYIGSEDFDGECVECFDEPTPWMVKNDHECESAPERFLESNCRNRERWRREMYCMRTCFERGLGYEGIDCC